MLKAKDLDEISELVEAFKPPLTFFEKSILVPNVRSRLETTIEFFEEFKRKCEEPQLAERINAVVGRIANPNSFPTSKEPPGASYVRGVAKICDESYIQPIKALLTKHPLNVVLASMENTTNFLNEAHSFFSSVIAVKEAAFLLSIRSSIYVKNVDTGKDLNSLSPEIELILAPFKTRLLELENIAKTTVESITLWGQQISRLKEKHIELITNLCGLKAARASVWFQLLAILFTVLFTVLMVYLSQRGTMYLEKRDLEAALGSVQNRVIALENENRELRIRPAPRPH